MELLLDSHCHTLASGHAYSTVKECFEAAAERGLKALAITDHSPKMPGAPGEMYFMNLDTLPDKICGVEVFRGVELNIMNYEGEIDLPNAIIKYLQVNIASLHPPCIQNGNIEQNTRAVTNAMNNPYIKIMGHLCDPRYPIDIKEVAKHAKKTKTVIEINEISSNPNGRVRAGGYEPLCELVRECIKNNVYLILGSDSHYHEKIGDFTNSLKLANACNVPEELLLNTDLDKFRKIMSQAKEI